MCGVGHAGLDEAQLRRHRLHHMVLAEDDLTQALLVIGAFRDAAERFLGHGTLRGDQRDDAVGGYGLAQPRLAGQAAFVIHVLARPVQQRHGLGRQLLVEDVIGRKDHGLANGLGLNSRPGTSPPEPAAK